MKIQKVITFVLINVCLFWSTLVVPVHADDIVPYDNQPIVTPEISNSTADTLGKAELFIEFLRQGGQVDFSETSSNTTAEDFLDNLGNLFEGVMNQTVDIYNWAQPFDIFDIDLGYKYYPKEMYHHIKPFRDKLPSYLAQQENATPTPNPDNRYLDYINCINGSHQWGNLTPYTTFANIYTGNGNGNLVKPLNNVTLYSHPSNFENFIKTYESGAYRSACVAGLNVATIYIHSSENGYWITDFQKPLDNTVFYYQWNNPAYTAFGSLNLDSGYGSATNGISANTYNYKTSSFQAYYETLDELFTFLVQTVRYVNIYVDNVPWSLVNQQASTNIKISDGTYLQDSNKPVEYQLTINNEITDNIDLYIDLDEILDKIQYSIDNHVTVDFPDFSDLIVDVNGQECFAVAIIEDDYTLDDLYLQQYGAMIPIFPLWVSYPISDANITKVATVGIVDVVPDDILILFGSFVLGMLCITLIHRLLE